MAGGLHLVKLCVGAGTVEDLQGWIDARRAAAVAAGRPYEQRHTTRMVPKRADDLLDGGSLYWVIKGTVRVRQRLLDVRPFVDGDGIGRCDLVLEPVLIRTAPQSTRPFQGWRYLDPKDAPRDLADGADDLPDHLRDELARLGLL